MMSKKQQNQPQELEEYVRVKEEFKNQYERKKETQREARERRQAIRELKESNDWN